ncbi:actin depolymerizing protein [Xylariomycetidae sp. FL0641]|nr:actin depolymerizing protein [Xylariomycetidae sp. FL0641]
MQSGISASQELTAEFNKLVSDPSLFGLIASIENEAVVPVATLPRTGADFAGDVAQLAAHVRPDQPLYVLLRRYEAAPALVAVTYVPDAARVRPKTLFSSTRNALLRELGKEHFRDDFWVNTPAELTARGFAQHEASRAQAAPLTAEERTLDAVKRAEAEAGRGTATRDTGLGSNSGLRLAAEAEQALEAFARQETNFATFTINDDETAVPIPTSTAPNRISEATAALPTDERRYTLFRCTCAPPQGGGGEEPKTLVLFFYTRTRVDTEDLPLRERTAVNTKNMIYARHKTTMMNVAESRFGVKIDKKYEVDEPAEIREADVLAEVFPAKSTAGLGRRRPAPPGGQRRVNQS